ncbi:hypothetical protein ABCY77_06720 [Thermoanaerobacter uzonensis]|nr:hypothetical protein [Thermoanaerobacter sp. YS13]
MPAYVCQKCGAVYYDTEVLDEAFKNKDKYEYISTK